MVACATLANPALIAAVLLGQLPFLWSAAFLLCALGAWRHRRVRRATLLAIVAQVIHPAVAVPIAALLVLTALPHEAQRSRLLACWALSLAAALPAAALTLAAPVVHQTSAFTAVYQLVTTVTVRAMVIVLPVLYAQLAARPHRRIGPLVTIVSVGLLAPMWRPFLLADGWHALWRPRPTTLDSFVASRAFTPGRIDRVLDAGDGKYGIYQVLRAGASLDSEPFPESLHREGFASDNAYATFLAERRVDTVVVTTSYADTFHSNEPEHLKSLAARGACVAHITVRLADTAPGWQTYDITHGCGSP